MNFPACVCGKCGRPAGLGAVIEDWLIAKRTVNNVERYMIRCPDCKTTYAKKQAGVPSGTSTSRIESQLARGWQAIIAQGIVIVAQQVDAGFRLEERHHGVTTSATELKTVDSLIDCMRRYEPDFRRWRLCPVAATSSNGGSHRG